MKTELTIEQSAHLIELGVDPKLASKVEVTYDKNVMPTRNPIFTLTDILAILPKEIEVQIGDNRYQIFALGIEWNPIHKEYVVGYGTHEVSIQYATELIDALYQLLIYVLTNFQK